MSANSDYDQGFYEDIEDGSRRSALAAVPYVLSLVPSITSVVDFGCGNGVWLAEFKRCGVSRVLGLDFGVGVASTLVIDGDLYHSTNLGAAVRVPPADLCISLEVAEHISQEFSDVFIDNLTNAAPRVLFSAAVPDQMGHHHINEQPPEYWISKFRQRGYVCLDILRPQLWSDARICWWYRQNIMLFVHQNLDREIEDMTGKPSFYGAYLVHPDMFKGRHQWLMNALEQLPRQERSETADSRMSKSNRSFNSKLFGLVSSLLRR